MIYFGIDIAKRLHVAVAISSDGEIIIEPFEFSNDRDGFSKLLSSLHKILKENFIIAISQLSNISPTLLEYS